MYEKTFVLNLDNCPNIRILNASQEHSKEPKDKPYDWEKDAAFWGTEKK